MDEKTWFTMDECSLRESCSDIQDLRIVYSGDENTLLAMLLFVFVTIDNTYSSLISLHKLSNKKISRHERDDGAIEYHIPIFNPMKYFMLATSTKSLSDLHEITDMKSFIRLCKFQYTLREQITPKPRLIFHIVQQGSKIYYDFSRVIFLTHYCFIGYKSQLACALIWSEKSCFDKIDIDSKFEYKLKYLRNEESVSIKKSISVRDIEIFDKFRIDANSGFVGHFLPVVISKFSELVSMCNNPEICENYETILSYEPCIDIKIITNPFKFSIIDNICVNLALESRIY